MADFHATGRMFRHLPDVLVFLVAFGVIGDARDIPACVRLWAQVVLGALLAYGSGVYLTTFCDIALAFLGPAVTIAEVIGAANGFNMIDGLDGLAGSNYFHRSVALPCS